MNELQIVLRQLIADSGKSLSEIAELGQVDVAYLRKLVSGEKCAPSSTTLLKIWVGLIACKELNENQPMLRHSLGLLTRAAALSRYADL